MKTIFITFSCKYSASTAAVLKSTKSENPAKNFASTRLGWFAKNGQMPDLPQPGQKSSTSLISIHIHTYTILSNDQQFQF